MLTGNLNKYPFNTFLSHEFEQSSFAVEYHVCGTEKMFTFKMTLGKMYLKNHKTHFYNEIFILFQVFIHDGRVHIIPIPSTPGELPIYPTGTPTVFQALQLVFGVHNTVAAAKIQTAINQRINRYEG